MNIVPSNQKIPITVDLNANNLFIGLTLFDCSSGAPVQVTGQTGQINDIYPMSNLAGSNSYLAFLTLVAQKTYVFLFQQFVDGTYAATTGTLNISESVASKIMAPLFTQGLDIRVGCEDQPNQAPVVVAQNSDSNVLLSFYDDDGAPIDISLADALTMTILEDDGVTVLTKSLTSGISLVEGKINQALVQFLAAEIGTLPHGDVDAQVGLVIGGSTEVFNVYSAITVEPSAV